MSGEARAAIPRPSICRVVILSRKDGERFPLPSSDAEQMLMLVRKMPATVVGVEIEENLTVLVMVGERWYRAPHKDLCGVGRPEGLELPGDTMVWSWPPRT